MISKTRAGLALAGAAALAALAACSPGSDATADKAGTAAAQAGLGIANARVVLAPVAGNPAAVYFDLSYSGAPGVSLTAVEVEGAGMTMIHDYAEDAGKMRMVMTDSVPLSADAPVSFAPGGLHVMAMDPSADLKPGAVARLTLTLSNGTTATVEAPVRAAGEER